MPEKNLRLRNLKQFLVERISTQEKQALRALGGDSQSVGSRDYGEMVSSVMARVVNCREQVDQQRDESVSLYEELMHHPEERRQVLVRNSARFRNWHLCAMLVDESQLIAYQYPRKAIQLANLALDVANHLEDTAYAPGTLEDLKARCLYSLGNARRMNGDVVRLVEEALAASEEHLSRGTGDPLEEATLLAMKGTLRGDQGRYKECFSLMDRAALICQRYGEDNQQSRMLVRKGIFCGYAGDPKQAIELFLTSLELMDARKEPRLKVAAIHNLILNLNELGRHQQAARMLEKERGFLLEFGDRLDRFRLRWLEGRIAHSRNDLEEAETALAETLRSFMHEGIAIDVAKISLELAEIYLEQGRTAEIKQLMEEILPCFKASDLHREAFAAIILFQKAAEMERVTLSLIQDSMAKLSRIRHN